VVCDQIDSASKAEVKPVMLRAERGAVKHSRFFETYQWTLSVLLNNLLYCF